MDGRFFAFAFRGVRYKVASSRGGYTEAGERVWTGLGQYLHLNAELNKGNSYNRQDCIRDINWLWEFTDYAEYAKSPYPVVRGDETRSEALFVMFGFGLVADKNDKTKNEIPALPIYREYRDNPREMLDRAIQNLRRDFNAPVLGHHTILWIVDYYAMIPQSEHKCDKCDKDGYIRFVTPCGQPARELCTCRCYRRYYSAEKAMLLKVESHSPGQQIAYYRIDTPQRQTVQFNKMTDFVYDGRPFPDLIFDRIWFLCNDDALKYADYLNSVKSNVLFGRQIGYDWDKIKEEDKNANR